MTKSLMRLLLGSRSNCSPKAETTGIFLLKDLEQVIEFFVDL
jgi:hypothetical protein